MIRTLKPREAKRINIDRVRYKLANQFRIGPSHAIKVRTVLQPGHQTHLGRRCRE
ncbi:MAG: hypothetical protein ACK5Q5_23470 [Planctomycetaceae bacterium]